MKKIRILFKKYIILSIIVGLSGIFFSCSTSSNEVVSAIKQATSKEQVQQVWEQYSKEIKSAKGQEKMVNAVKEKLSKMELSDEEIAHWHNQFRAFTDIKPSLNIIVIPDLSNRLLINYLASPQQIKSQEVIPEPQNSKQKGKNKRGKKFVPQKVEPAVQQIEKVEINPEYSTESYDKELIKEIYRLFFEKAKKSTSTDKIIVDITDNTQVKGKFAIFAKNLAVDMTDKEQGEQSRKYLKSKEDNFIKTLDSLYMFGDFGADFEYYFNRIAPMRILKSTIETEYINKIIILTDGYLELENGIIHTKIAPWGTLKTAVENGNLKQVMQNYGLKIPHPRNKFQNTEVLMLEIYERPGGEGWHKEILQEYWKDWFKLMEIKNIKEDNYDFFQLHQHNIEYTKKIIQKFLK